jgi:hypothetical protein
VGDSLGSATRRRRRRTAAGLLVVLALAGAACGRDSDETGSDGPSTTAAAGVTTTTAAASDSRLDAGGFGDHENVCQDGDASGATDVGVTDDSIQVGTFTDKGFQARPGLDEEMYDAAVAFADWCNEHGGINGRELVVADRDAALTDYNARIIESCSQDFAMVGGGAVLDDSDNGGRVECGLPSIPGYVVSAAAREADLEVQPLPNPLHRLSAGVYQRIADSEPDLIAHYGTITSAFGSVLLVRDTSVEAAEHFGYTHVFDREYNANGESNWRPFIEGMRDAGVKILEWVGEPTFLTQALQTMQTVGYQPDLIITQGNFYDTTFAQEAGDIAQNVVVRSQFTPFELADTNPATADYLELMQRYNPSGKVALLGAQATSAFLLFAQSAAACGSNLTRQCLLEQAGSVTEWTGGGLHAVEDPSTNSPSPCFALLRIDGDKFVVDEDLTGANEGIFNCDDANLIDVAAN